MNKQELMSAMAAILTTLHELDCSCTESSCYMALGWDMNKWNLIKEVMEKAGFIKVSSYTVRLTALGKETAVKVNEAIAAK